MRGRNDSFFLSCLFAPFVPETTFNSSQTHYRYSKEKRNIIRSMDLLVIDEISMVRADLLDAVDATLRRYRDREKPFWWGATVDDWRFATAGACRERQ